MNKTISGIGITNWLSTCSLQMRDASINNSGLRAMWPDVFVEAPFD